MLVTNVFNPRWFEAKKNKSSVSQFHIKPSSQRKQKSKSDQSQKPYNKILQQIQRLDELSSRLLLRIRQHIMAKQSGLTHLVKRLETQHPRRQILLQKDQLNARELRLLRAVKQQLAGCQNRFALSAAKLDSISPLKTLDRGYSITRDDKTHALIKSVASVKTGQKIRVQLSDGELSADVTSRSRSSS